MSQPISRSLIIFSILLAVALLLSGAVGFNKWRFDTQSRELAITINQSMLASGDAGPLIDHADPVLLDQMDAASLQGYVSAIAEILGPLQSIQAIAGATPLNPVAVLRGTPTASYTLELVFAAEATRAVMDMQRSSGQWRVTNYLLQSALLFN